MKNILTILLSCFLLVSCNKQVDNNIVPVSRGRISANIDGKNWEITTALGIIKQGVNSSELTISGSGGMRYISILIANYNGVGRYNIKQGNRITLQFTDMNPSPIYEANISIGEGEIIINSDALGITSGYFNGKVIDKQTQKEVLIEGGNFQIKY